MTSEVTGAGGSGPRSLEASVGFVLSHRLRIEILAELHDKPATAPELAGLLEVPRARLRYHIDELLKDGSIEVADRAQTGNVTSNIYRVTRLAFHSGADWQAMPLADRQEECAVILRATWAEALASLWAGKFHSDPLVVNIWNRIVLDSKGRDDLAAEQASSWARMEEIEGEAATRRIETGEAGIRSIIASFGYERGRSNAPDPQPLESGIVEGSFPRESTTPTLRTGRTIEEAVSNSIAHRIRIEILAALHEGPAPAASLARMIGQPIPLLSHHVRKLVEDGSIRVVGKRQVRNFEQPVYSANILPLYDSEQWSELSAEERQVTSAVTLRAAMAESLTSLWAGKLHTDASLMLAWKPVVLDPTGRVAMTKEQERSWNRICRIESEVAERLESNGQLGKLYVVTMLGFQRSRKSPAHEFDRGGSP